MANPNVQNDFSYYRRTLNRMKAQNKKYIEKFLREHAEKNNNEKPKEMPREKYPIVVHDELANRMSLFYANATPMLRCIIDASIKTVRGVSFFFFIIGFLLY